jgi:hypothetical protein
MTSTPIVSSTPNVACTIDEIFLHLYNLTAIQRLPVIVIIFVSSLILMNRKFSILTRDDFAIAHHVFPRKLRGIPRLVEILTIGKQNPLVQPPGVPTTPQ